MSDPGQAFRDNPHKKVSIDLMHEAVAPVYGSTGASRAPTHENEEEGFGRAHYEQHMHVTGNLQIGDDVYERQLGWKDASFMLSVPMWARYMYVATDVQYYRRSERSHAPGTPFDVRALDVDFYCSGGLKWLLGGTGVAFMYARPELWSELAPRASGWFAHREQFRFDPRTLELHDDARRLEAGTPPLLPVYAQLGGLELIEELGPREIRRRTMALAEDLIEMARADLTRARRQHVHGTRNPFREVQPEPGGAHED